MMQGKKTTSHKSKHLKKKGKKKCSWSSCLLLEIIYCRFHIEKITGERSRSKGRALDQTGTRTHMVRKKRKATDLGISSPVGDGEKSGCRREQRRRRGKSSLWRCLKIQDGKSQIFSQQSNKKKKKKKKTRTENVQRKEGRLTQCFNSCCCFKNFLLWFFTPAAAHLLFGVVHVTIEQRSFVQPRQRLRQILIRTGSWLSALRGD